MEIAKNQIIEIDDVGTGHGISFFAMGLLAGDDFRYLELHTHEEIVPRTLHCLVEEMGITRGEIHLCQGNVLDKLAHKLTRLGFVVHRVHIEGKLQDDLDAAFLESLRIKGMPEHLLENLFDYHRFAGDLFTWCSIDPTNRYHFLNTIPPKRGLRFSTRRSNKEAVCFECRKPIPVKSPRTVLQVTSGYKPICRHDLHPECIKLSEK
jgi:hypothetical protein